MNNSKEIKIKYRSGIMHKGEIDGKVYREYEYDYYTANTSSVKRYKNALMLLMGVTGCELHLIEWLSENMTEGNYVQNNEVTRKAFIAFHAKYKKAGNKEYSDHAVQKAFQKLTNEGLLIPKVRGVYIVNPDYYFGKSDEERVKSIKLMLEFKAGVETRVSVDIKK